MGGVAIHLGGEHARTTAVLVLAVLATATAGSVSDATAASAPTSRAPAASAAAAPLLTMKVDTRKVRHRRRLPRSFVGFSTEVPNAPRIVGSPATGVNVVADGLYSNLRSAGSGGPTLRIGGSSAEQAWWNPAHGPRPPGIDFDIDEDYLQYVKAFQDRNGSALVLTLNLVSRDASTAVEYARAAQRVLGPRAVRAYELGNEPDLYPAFKQRPSGYGFGDYLSDYDARAGALRSGIPGIRLTGPSACCDLSFLDRLPVFLSREKRNVAAASLHEYFGGACPGVKPGTPGYPKRSTLLGGDTMERVITGFREAVRQSAKAGKRVELTETNSFACGGQPGVSDTFASALWGAEYLMRTAGTGIVGANFHTFGRAYSPFDFEFASGQGWTGTARPLYYGALLFARATAGRATLLLDPVSRARVRKGANAVAFPSLSGRRLRVMVLAKSRRSAGRVVIAVPRGAHVGVLSRLTAPSLGSRTGVQLASQSVAPRSSTGRLGGRARRFRVVRRRGRYAFRMPAAGAALLEVRVRR